jgi:very-short-patch-repair endonuclease
LIDLAPPGADHDSPFEAEVCRALRDRGWTVHAQVGCAGFAIDLAVVDPNQPGRYLLGIECDGATYHSSPTARDRDRLRQEVLERLGWKIQRIWSADWFRRRDQIIQDLHDQLTRLRDQPPAAPAVRNDRSAPTAAAIVAADAGDRPEDADGDERALAGSSPRRRHQRRFDPDSIGPQDIRQAILTVLEKEFGMSAEALVQRTARFLGFGRTGRRIAEDIEEQIEALLRQQRICRDGNGALKLSQSNT